MNPALLLPVLFGAALLVGAFTGHVPPEQLAAGAALLLVPGADRFAPLLRQLLRLGPAQPALPSRDLTTDEMRAFIEAAARAAYERYGDACGWRTVGGGGMPRWADQHERLRLCWREAARGALGLQPGVNPGELAPVVPAILPTTPPIALLLFLLPLLALAPSCASWPAWRGALAACGVQMAPAGVEAGVALALRGGDGWAAALAGLASTYGDCLVKAQVLRHAQGEGPEPPRSQAVAAPLEGLIGGELTASSSQVSKAEAERRAAAWLRGHR